MSNQSHTDVYCQRTRKIIKMRKRKRTYVDRRLLRRTMTFKNNFHITRQRNYGVTTKKSRVEKYYVKEGEELSVEDNFLFLTFWSIVSILEI